MSTDLDPGSFLRIASISIACYDYLVTLPVEVRLYRSINNLKFGVVLFILIRYMSIVLLTLSNVGWFYHGFSPAACARYYMVSPVFKVIQTMISQTIIGYRTWNIAQRSTDVGIFLLFFGCLIATLESFSNLQSRLPLQTSGNCSPGNDTSRIPQWVFYLLSTVFDVATIVLSSFFLVGSAGGFSRMSSILRMLFYDGMGYIVVLTAANIMNLVMYRNSIGHETQSSGASFGFMIVWIMSQRFLIHIHEAAEVRAQREFIFGPTSRALPRGVGASKVFSENGDINLDVQVQIEQAVMVDYHPRTQSRLPRSLWDRKPSDITNVSSTNQSLWGLK